jgi:hypothetical protein
MISRSMVKSASGECHGSQALGTSNGGSSLCGNEEVALWFMTHTRGMESEDKSTWEIEGPALQNEDPMSGLNWLYVVMALLKALLCALFPSWRRISGVVLVVLVLLLQGISHCVGIFLLL